MDDNTSATVERLRRLRGIVVDAKSVPMSASCMVNRSDVLALIDQIVSGLPEDLEESRTLKDERFEAHQAARQQAERIVEDARAEAKELVGTSQVARQADEYAAATRAKADEDAAGIKKEADRFIDSRLAEFEASLQKTQGQVGTMRAKLAARSGLDDNDVEALPSI